MFREVLSLLKEPTSGTIAFGIPKNPNADVCWRHLPTGSGSETPASAEKRFAWPSEIERQGHRADPSAVRRAGYDAIYRTSAP